MKETEMEEKYIVADPENEVELLYDAEDIRIDGGLI